MGNWILVNSEKLFCLETGATITKEEHAVVWFLGVKVVLFKSDIELDICEYFGARVGQLLP